MQNNPFFFGFSFSWHITVWFGVLAHFLAGIFPHFPLSILSPCTKETIREFRGPRTLPADSGEALEFWNSRSADSTGGFGVRGLHRQIRGPRTIPADSGEALSFISIVSIDRSDRFDQFFLIACGFGNFSVI